MIFTMEAPDGGMATPPAKPPIFGSRQVLTASPEEIAYSIPQTMPLKVGKHGNRSIIAPMTTMNGNKTIDIVGINGKGSDPHSPLIFQ